MDPLLRDGAFEHPSVRVAALRLVIPVHDEGERLVAFLDDLVALAPAGAPPTDLVIVDDGSRPGAAAAHRAAVERAARRLAAAGTPHTAAVVAAPGNLGKGAAIRLGWGAGDGAAWLGFVDGDGAVPAAEVWRLARRLDGAPAFDALLSVRRPGAGRDVRRTPLRDLQGRAFATAARALLGLGVRDPQCGLKFFRAGHLAPLLPALRERRWLLDLEVLLSLAARGARLAEEPIDWRERGSSKLVFALDPLRMLLGVLRLRARRGAGGPGAR